MPVTCVLRHLVAAAATRFRRRQETSRPIGCGFVTCQWPRRFCATSTRWYWTTFTMPASPPAFDGRLLRLRVCMCPVSHGQVAILSNSNSSAIPSSTVVQMKSGNKRPLTSRMYWNVIWTTSCFFKSIFGTPFYHLTNSSNLWLSLPFVAYHGLEYDFFWYYAVVRLYLTLVIAFVWSWRMLNQDYYWNLREADCNTLHAQRD